MFEQFRLRMRDIELKFLEDSERRHRGLDVVIAFSKILERNDPGLIRKRRRRFVAQKLQRKFESVLEDKKKHMRSMARAVVQYVGRRIIV